MNETAIKLPIPRPVANLFYVHALVCCSFLPLPVANLCNSEAAGKNIHDDDGMHHGLCL